MVLQRIKQHLRIKAFLWHQSQRGATQVWTAIAVYRLVAILKNVCIECQPLHHSQILSLTLFEKTPISQALAQLPPTSHH